MRPRLNLWLKKRGARRTGSPRWAASGEVLYHAVFIAVGLIAAWLHITSVLVPEWRRRARLADYVPGRCEIVETRVDSRVGVAGTIEYLPRCYVHLKREGEPTPLVLANAGMPTTSHRRALRESEQWVAGETVDCWFDPENPRSVVMSRDGQGWPLIVLVIPISLIVLGSFGVVRAVLRGGASDEFRRVVTQATLAANQDNPASPPPTTGLPAAEPIGDSPGTRERFRLPLDSKEGWRLTGMLLICVAWNALVGFFLYGVVHDHVSGAPDWAVTLVIMPLAIGGGWLAYQMLRDARGVTGVGSTRIELSDHPLRPGGECRGAVIQTGQFTARTLSVALICEEIAVYRQGTDTRRSVEVVRRDVLLREKRLVIDASEPFEGRFAFTLPTGAMHSFRSMHNEVRWSIEVIGTPTKWPRFERRFRLCVYPNSWPVVESSPLANTTTGPSAEAIL